MESHLKIAYICEPQIGGTYTSFRQVREQLLPMDIDYRCIPPFDKQAFAATRFAHDAGVDFIEYPDREPAAMARRLVDHLQAEQFSAVVVLPSCYPFVSSLPPFLPRGIRCIARMPHNARGVYWPTALMAAHFNRIIAVGPRLKKDLVAKYGVAEAKVEVIANGVDTGRFQPGTGASPRRAIYVGRIEDLQKNVFLLPKILSRALRFDPEVHLTVAGSGPDLDRLRARFAAAGLDDHVNLAGRVDPEQIPALLQRHGVFILPSRFEGCSNSTLEAMACGCVPLLSRLPGISDEITVHGRSGLLFTPGDGNAMGSAWGRLARAEQDWARMRREARDRVVTHFSLERMGAAYARLFRAVVEEPDLRPPARPLADYGLNARLSSTWRRWIPERLKKHFRTWAARMGVSP
jgi:glycosyltransferase involved in cell wall biosynthesis